MRKDKCEERLKLALPKGSLCKRLLLHLREAGYDVCEPESNGLCGTTDDLEFHLVDRRLVPKLVKNGSFFGGVTGQDIHVDSQCDLHEFATMDFARNSDRPSQWVLAAKKGFQSPSNRRVRIGCELPRFASEVLGKLEIPFKYRIIEVPGTEEAAVKWDYVDVTCVVTESGKSIKAYCLEKLPGFGRVFVSHPAIYTLHQPTGERLEVLQRLADDLHRVIGYHGVEED